MPIHARSKTQRLGKIGSCLGKSERCHSQPKKPIHEIPASTRSAIEVFADQLKAKLTSFKTEIIKNDPVRSKSDPTRSRLANERYDARVLSDGVCWSRPKLVGMATVSTIIAMAHKGILQGLISSVSVPRLRLLDVFVLDIENPSPGFAMRKGTSDDRTD